MYIMIKLSLSVEHVSQVHVDGMCTVSLLEQNLNTEFQISGLFVLQNLASCIKEYRLIL